MTHLLRLKRRRRLRRGVLRRGVQVRSAKVSFNPIIRFASRNPPIARCFTTCNSPIHVKWITCLRRVVRKKTVAIIFALAIICARYPIIETSLALLDRDRVLRGGRVFEDLGIVLGGGGESPDAEEGLGGLEGGRIGGQEQSDDSLHHVGLRAGG